VRREAMPPGERHGVTQARLVCVSSTTKSDQASVSRRLASVNKARVVHLGRLLVALCAVLVHGHLGEGWCQWLVGRVGDPGWDPGWD